MIDLLVGKNMGAGLLGEERRARFAIGVGGGESDSARAEAKTSDWRGDWKELHIAMRIINMADRR